MCGIAGIMGWGNLRRDDLPPLLSFMGESLVHRGPDSGGEWIDDALDIPLGLSHRRLAILDLSPAGAQPMVSSSGQYVITFNGEVYNHHDLRKDIDVSGSLCFWRGRSDTEVVLAAIERWGVHEAVRRMNGMFAFVIWDRIGREMHFVRDRAGVKPLYIALGNDCLLFASELRAIAATGRLEFRLNRPAVAAYIAYGYFPPPSTVYDRCLQLVPGSVLTVKAGKLRQSDWEWIEHHSLAAYECPINASGEALKFVTYWSPLERWRAGQQDPFKGTPGEAVDEFERLLRDSVRIRMESDVPLGAFLSGGIDSSLVVAIMQSEASRAVHTFSIGFDDSRYDESGHARAVADYLGTSHTEYRISEDDCLRVVPDLANLLDEPMGDSSVIPTYLVSKLCRGDVTVAMTGDGGDEIFWGYWKYRHLRALKILPLLPKTIKKMLDSFAGAIMGAPRDAGGVAQGKFRIARGLRLMAARDLRAAYIDFSTDPHEKAQLERTGPVGNPFRFPSPGYGQDDISRLLSLWDFQSYLPGDLLVKVDRASMAVSLECREPLLDYRLVEFGACLPGKMKINWRQGKIILRTLLYRMVDRRIVDRPKQGFAVPLGHWLRQPLKKWGEGLLHVRIHGFDEILEPEALRRKWDDHIAGRANHSMSLWHALILKQWMLTHPWN